MTASLIIFDCDGVLVDTEPTVNRIFVDMVAEAGHHLDREASLREFTGVALAHRVAAIRGRTAWVPAENFLSELEGRLSAAAKRGIAPVSGVRELVTSLSSRSCVASNGSLAEMRAKLAGCGLLPLFEPHLFSAEQVGTPKPNPAVFLHAAAAMATAPQDCIVVEDSLPGVRAGVRAGMRVLGYSARTDASLLAEAGAEIFSTMAELPALLLKPRPPAA